MNMPDGTQTVHTTDYLNHYIQIDHGPNRQPVGTVSTYTNHWRASTILLYVSSGSYLKPTLGFPNTENRQKDHANKNMM